MVLQAQVMEPQAQAMALQVQATMLLLLVMMLLRVELPLLSHLVLLLQFQPLNHSNNRQRRVPTVIMEDQLEDKVQEVDFQHMEEVLQVDKV